MLQVSLNKKEMNKKPLKYESTNYTVLDYFQCVNNDLETVSILKESHAHLNYEILATEQHSKKAYTARPQSIKE